MGGASQGAGVKRLLVLLAASSAILLSLAGSASATSYPAEPSTLGPVDDGPDFSCTGYGAARDVNFPVFGLAGPIYDVGVSFMMSPAHGQVGDLKVDLIAPGGAPSQTLFERTGSLTASGSDRGYGSNVAGPYTFSDTAPESPSWWQAAAAADASSEIPSGSYRASTPGGAPTGGANALFGPTFASATPNGNWTLRFRDHCQLFTGSVFGATLFLNEGPPPDTSPPDTTITIGPKAKSSKKSAHFEFSSTESGSTFECQLDDNLGFVACTSPQDLKVGKGKHTFQVRATDSTGNVDLSPATYAWKVKKKHKHK